MEENKEDLNQADLKTTTPVENPSLNQASNTRKQISKPVLLLVIIIVAILILLLWSVIFRMGIYLPSNTNQANTAIPTQVYPTKPPEPTPTPLPTSKDLEPFISYKAPAGWEPTYTNGEYGLGIQLKSPDFKLNDGYMSGMWIIINRKVLPQGQDLKAACDDRNQGMGFFEGYDYKNSTLDGIAALTSYHNSDGYGKTFSYCLIKDGYIWELRFLSDRDEAKYQSVRDEFIKNFHFKQ